MPSKVADRASVAGNTAVTTVDLVLTGMTVGNILIIRTAANNAGGGGAAVTCTPSNQSGTPLDIANRDQYQQNADPGAANAGVTANIISAEITATSGTVRLTYGSSVVQAAVAEEWTGLFSVDAVGIPVQANGTTTNLASMTDTSVAIGALAYGVIAVEGPNGDTYTNDADTTNGSWTPLTKLGTTNATATDNVTIYGAYKVVTATGAQTYNPTIGVARDSAGILVEFAAFTIHSATITTAWSGWTATAAGAVVRDATISTAWAGWTATADGTVFAAVHGTIATNWGAAAETIRPDSTSSASVNLVVSSGVLGNIHSLIDDDPATPDDGDYVIHPGGTGSGNFVVSLSDVAVVSGVTSVRVRMRSSRVGYTSGSSRLSATIERADGTDVTSDVTINQNADGIFDNDVDMPLNAAGLADSSSTTAINGWRLRVDFSNNAADTIVISAAVDLHQRTAWTATATGTVVHPAKISTVWTAEENVESLRPDSVPFQSGTLYQGIVGTDVEMDGDAWSYVDDDPEPELVDDGDYILHDGEDAASVGFGLTDAATVTQVHQVVLGIRFFVDQGFGGGVVDQELTAWLTDESNTAVSETVTLWRKEETPGGFYVDRFEVVLPLNSTGLTEALDPAEFNDWIIRLGFTNAALTDTNISALEVNVAQGRGWTATAVGTVTGGTPTVDGTISTAWAGWTATADGVVTHPATIATAWSGWTATADGVVTHPATATTAWSGWTATAQGHRVWDATIATAFSGWTATASATVTHPATITTAFDGWTATATATRETAATASTAWSGWTAAATGEVTRHATIATAWAGWSATADGTVTIHATIRTLWAEWEVDSDDFNRADAAAPGLGAGWDAPGFALDDNMALKNSGGDYGRRLTDIGTLDHWVEVEVVGTPGVQSDDHNMVVARADATLGQNAVLGYVNPDSGKQGLIARFQSGSFVVMSGGTTGLDISGTYTLRLWIVDGEARLYHNGALVHTQDVSTLTSLGTFGGLNANTGSPPFDNYRAGTAGWRATAVGHRVWAGTITTAWDGWTATATGTVQTSVNGTIDTAWSGWTATATATRETFGTITTAWAGWTATADGLRTTAGAITTIWSGWTATADATVIHPATIATAFDGWTATAAGHRVFDAAITTAWAGWTATAVGEVSTPGGTIDGTITTAWSGWTATALGVVTHLATIDTAWSGWTATALGHRVWDATITTAWSGWTATATATRTVNATIATALAGWTATASATRTTFGAIATNWAGWTATATGLRTTAGAITTVWAGWTATAIAETAGQVNASIATEWAGWTATASATVTVVATIDTTWGAWSGIAVATRQVNGTVETLWGGWNAQGTAILTRLGTISTGWAGWTATAIGTRTINALGTGVWVGWTASAVASVFGTLVIIGILTAVRVDPIRTATSLAPGHSAVRVNPVLTAESATPQRIATRYDPNRVASRP